jgi:hypothetical protein
MGGENEEKDDDILDPEPEPTPKPKTRAKEVEDDSSDEDPDDIKRRLKLAESKVYELSKENAKKRRQLEDIEKENQKKTDEKLSELEKAQRLARQHEVSAREAQEKAKTWEDKYTRSVKSFAVIAEAQSLFEYPQDVPALVNLDKLEIDPEDGTVIGAKELVQKLAKSRPGMLKAEARGTTREENRGFGDRRRRQESNGNNPHMQERRSGGDYIPM